MDSGFDSLDNIKVCIGKNSDYIIKRNLRKESKDSWLLIAQKHGSCTEERPGKEVYLVESGDKKVIQQRMKQSGTRWNIQSG